MNPLNSSFRDRDGFMFEVEGRLLRCVNASYQAHYEQFIESGLYQELVDKKYLISHKESDYLLENAYKVLEPEKLSFISYPYEWCFSQWKDAAILTLDIQLLALDKGMTLKDASAYNVQFHQGKAIFIDTLSFEKYEEGKPWQAYSQFCRHFLAPLLLFKYKSIALHRAFQSYIDGFPLTLVSALLPVKTYFSPTILSHIHLHAKSEKWYGDVSQGQKARNVSVSLNGLKGLLSGLKSYINDLDAKVKGTWSDYYEDMHNYNTVAFAHKKELVEAFLVDAQAQRIWDLGGNTGVFSRVATEKGMECVCMDIDEGAVEWNYRKVKEEKNTLLLPLIMDFTQPSPAIGWANKERMTIQERTKPDVIMALALLHHLCIGNNVPLTKIAAYFSALTQKGLIIEFIPKSDEQVQKLLATRKDIFDEYEISSFEETFCKYFYLEKKVRISDSQRCLYYFKNK